MAGKQNSLSFLALAGATAILFCLFYGCREEKKSLVGPNAEADKPALRQTFTNSANYLLFVKNPAGLAGINRPTLNKLKTCRALRGWVFPAGAYRNLPGNQKRLFQSGPSGTRREVWLSQAIFASRNLYKKYPAFRPVGLDGRRLRPRKWYFPLNPAHPDLRRRQLARVKRLGQMAGVQGIFLDFIRWPIFWEEVARRGQKGNENDYRWLAGFSPVSKRAFSQKNTGLSIQWPDKKGLSKWLAGPAGQAWQKWRAKQITDFVRAARGVLDQSPGKKQLGVFLVPTRFRRWTAQAPGRLSEQASGSAGGILVLAPMLFTGLVGRDMADYRESWENLLRQLRTGRSLSGQTESPGKGARLWPVWQSFGQTRQEVRALPLTSPGAERPILYHGEGLVQPANFQRWSGSLACRGADPTIGDDEG